MLSLLCEHNFQGDRIMNIQNLEFIYIYKRQNAIICRTIASNKFLTISTLFSISGGHNKNIISVQFHIHMSLHSARYKYVTRRRIECKEQVLWEAVGKGDESLLEEILQPGHDLDLEKLEPGGCTPLGMAAQDGRKKMVEELLGVPHKTWFRPRNWFRPCDYNSFKYWIL